MEDCMEHFKLKWSCRDPMIRFAYHNKYPLNLARFEGKLKTFFSVGRHTRRKNGIK